MAPSRTTAPRERAGILVFLVLTFAASWLPALLLRPWWDVQHLHPALRFFVCSVGYAVTMGWQPLVAVLLVRQLVERSPRLDAGLRPPRPRFLMLALVVPLLALALADLLARALQYSAEHSAPLQSASALLASSPWLSVLFGGLVLAGAMLVYLQCLTEEVGWRGYFLVRAMETAGPWRGLVAHGFIWGLWYAPIFVFTSDELKSSSLRAAAFTITCMLLGIVLGWLRLASRSVMPSTVANVILTLGAGLPVVLAGIDVGPRGAIYHPEGWAPLLAIVLGVSVTRLRRAVITPKPSAPQPFALDLRSLH